MIPSLAGIAEKFGVSHALVPLVLAGLLTALVLLVPSVVRWFEDRNS